MTLRSDPVIVDCACGYNHLTMPTDVDGTELVCRIHKRHIPCRRCALDELSRISHEAGLYEGDWHD